MYILEYAEKIRTPLKWMNDSTPLDGLKVFKTVEDAEIVLKKRQEQGSWYWRITKLKAKEA